MENLDNFDITEYFTELIENSRSIDVAESEFKRIVADDNALREVYKQWCADNGYTTRRGFAEYADQYVERHQEIWETLSNTDDDL